MFASTSFQLQVRKANSSVVVVSFISQSPCIAALFVIACTLKHKNNIFPFQESVFDDVAFQRKILNKKKQKNLQWSQKCKLKLKLASLYYQVC